MKVIKDCWKSKWMQKKTTLIQENSFSNNSSSKGGWSGKLTNPGKRFFLQLAADVVREVNCRRDNEGMSLAHKAMVRCGLGLDASGQWNVGMLYPHLRDIIQSYPRQFDGALPSDE